VRRRLPRPRAELPRPQKLRSQLHGLRFEAARQGVIGDQVRGRLQAKLERVLRDMALGWSHFNTAQNDWGYAEVAKSRLGLPPGSLF
jgi:hypothetical protein